MQPIFRTQLIWVKFTIGQTFGTALPFQDQPILNGCYVVGCEVVSTQGMVLTPDSTPVTNALQNYTVTWNDGSDKRHQDVPCVTLFALGNGGIWKDYTPFLCDFQKSRVTYRGTVALAATEAVPFIVYYMRPEDYASLDLTIQQLQSGG